MHGGGQFPERESSDIGRDVNIKQAKKAKSILTLLNAFYNKRRIASIGVRIHHHHNKKRIKAT